MTENHDDRDPAFEDRVRGLLEGDVAARGVSVTSVIAGAHKRRARRRATAAGSSVAVLGVAAGVAALGLHSAGSGPAPGAAGSEAAGTVTSAPRTTTAPITAPTTLPTTTPATESPAIPPDTCSASVTGPVPALTPRKAEGLDFEVITGLTAHVPWAVQIHAFPDWQSWLDWRKTQTNPPVPSTASHVLGPPALIKGADGSEFSLSSVPHYSFGFAGMSMGGSGVGGSGAGVAKILLVQAWVSPRIDHLCLQFAAHADFEPVYRIQTGSFAVFAYPEADKPEKVIGYDTSGQVVATGTGSEGLLPPDGK